MFTRLRSMLHPSGLVGSQQDGQGVPPRSAAGAPKPSRRLPIDPRLLAAATILAILPHAAASLAMPSARSLFPAFPWCLAILGSIGGLAALLGAAASRSDSGRLSFLGAALAAGASAMYWLGAGFYDAALQGAAPPWLGNIGVWLFLLPLMLTLGLYPIGIAIVALVSAGGAFVVVVRGDRGRAS